MHPPCTITQPGGHDRAVTTRRVGSAYVATMRLRVGRQAGPLRIRAVGTDKGGQHQGFTQTLPLH